jgi:hypothetical protein
MIYYSHGVVSTVSMLGTAKLPLILVCTYLNLLKCYAIRYPAKSLGFHTAGRWRHNILTAGATSDPNKYCHSSWHVSFVPNILRRYTAVSQWSVINDTILCWTFS